MDLDLLRKEIDQIDSDLVKLLDRRAEIASEVGKSKATSGRATFDPGRAKAVILEAIKRSNGAFPTEGLRYVFQEMISACLNLQKPLRVAYLGPSSTWAHQAAVREFGSSVEFIGCRVIREVFSSVDKGQADYGVVPIENSNGGTVHTTLDAFIDYDVRVCSEVLLPINHALLSAVQLDKIKNVYSHPQALMQCSKWLKENLPDAKLIDTESTTQGMQQAEKDSEGAAIGSDNAAEKYGLMVLAKRIQNDIDNTTRFLVLSKTDNKASGDDKTSLMFSVKDRPGALFEILYPFKELGINLSKLESRPTKRRAWEQAFFVDADGHRNDKSVLEAIERIREHCDSLRVLGSYPRDKSPREIEELQRLAIKEKAESQEQ